MTSLPTVLRRAAATQATIGDPVTAGILMAAADRIEVLEAGYGLVLSASREMMATQRWMAEESIRKIGSGQKVAA